MDLRTQYTLNVLQRVMLELLKEKPVRSINVKEICARADISRGTFYRYYANPAELKETIIDAALEDFFASTANGDAKTLLEKIKQNPDTYTTLILHDEDNSFTIKLFNRVLAPTSEENPLSPKQLHATWAAYGASAVVKDWLANGMQIPPADLAHFITQVIAGSKKEIGL